MRRLDPLDSKSPLVRVIERCKRGAAVSIIVTLCGLVGLLVYIVAKALSGLVSAPPLAEAALTLGAGASAFLWLVGSRDVLKAIAAIARASDTAD